MIDPQAKQFLAAVAAMDPPPTPWERMPPAEARAAFKGLDHLFGDRVPIGRVEDMIWAGTPVRFYDDRPQGDQSPPGPAVMYFHGGGWVLGDLETHDALCRQLAKQSGLPVVSVDYPLSPEYPHPAAIHTCYAATEHLANHANDHAVDPNQIVLAGDSAGGHLAASVAIRIRDEAAAGRFAGRVVMQVLIYPVIAPDFTTQSYQDFATGHGLTQTEMRYFWDCYAGADGDRRGAGQGGQSEVLISPADAASLTGLPEAIILTAGYDVLRDDGIGYAQSLREAGVTVDHQNYDGMIHAFVHLAGVFDAGRAAIDSISQRLSRLASQD